MNYLEIQNHLKNKEKEIFDKKNEIYNATISLQNELKQKEQELVSLQNELKSTMLLNIKNENFHILDRFIFWLNYSDSKYSDSLIKDGPMRKHIFIDMERYETYDIKELILSWLCFNVCKSEESEYPTIEEFNKLSNSKQEKVILILNDCINQNISSFKCDW